MVTPSKKTILIPLLAGASLLALQFASDAKHQSNVERKIESLTGANGCNKVERYKLDPCLITPPECNAKREGKFSYKRAAANSELVVIRPGNDDMIDSWVFNPCPPLKKVKCVDDGWFIFSDYIWKEEPDKYEPIDYLHDVGTRICPFK